MRNSLNDQPYPRNRFPSGSTKCGETTSTSMFSPFTVWHACIRSLKRPAVQITSNIVAEFGL